MSRFRLYPPIEPYKNGYYEPDRHHRIYWEECGNPNGIPVIFLHGGPGAGCNPLHRRFFDPARYRIILFDQRGCGRSMPNASLKNNTTQDLIHDIEALRQQCNIDKWIVFGGSWGSTLGLAYAQAHPSNCLALVLRGIFLGRPKELDWFFLGVRNLFPEIQEEFMNFLPDRERKEYLKNFYHRLCDADPDIHMPAAKAWSDFEAHCVSLEPNPELVAQSYHPAAALAIARLEAHYMIHNLFLEDAPILENIDKIQHIPGYLIQGRYDAICPPITAYELHKAWQNSHLTLLNDAGHSSSEPSIIHHLVKTMEHLKKIFA